MQQMLLLFTAIITSLHQFGTSITVKAKNKNVNEMLLPRHSTTALMCDPMFFGRPGKARWYHNGVEVANVTSASNAVLHDRPYFSDQTMPEVGFLIITNISLDDEGYYWCRRDDTKQDGEVAKIVVAYVDHFASDARPIFNPPVPLHRQSVIGHCPETNAVPLPTVTWLFNDEPIDLSMTHIEQDKNGTLIIKQFLRHNIGVYECIVSNFAGKTSAKAFLDIQTDERGSLKELYDETLYVRTCQSAFHNGLLWFLFGSVLTSCTMLLCIASNYGCIQSRNYSRTVLCPGYICRSHPSLAPGFRKVISPFTDQGRSERTNSERE